MSPQENEMTIDNMTRELQVTVEHGTSPTLRARMQTDAGILGDIAIILALLVAVLALWTRVRRK